MRIRSKRGFFTAFRMGAAGSSKGLPLQELLQRIRRYCYVMSQREHLILKQSLGINGYLNLNYVNQMFLDKGIINGVYINSDDDVKGKLVDINKILSTQSQSDLQGVFEEFTGLIAVFIGVMVRLHAGA